MYGTVLVDIDSHRPVDLLADREAESLTALLLTHPRTDVICRDRASVNAEGTSTRAPDAIQVAAEISEKGNRGNRGTVGAYLAPFRALDDLPTEPIPVVPAQPLPALPVPPAAAGAARASTSRACNTDGRWSSATTGAV